MAFKILAVDGGGIRGLLPALVLAAIEDRIHRPICELFDLVAGTSTGGIIALGLTKPGEDGKVQYAARDLVRLYEQEGRTIFPPRILGGQFGLLRGAKYPADGIDGTLRRYFGEARLRDAITPVLIPSYDIEKQTPIFFKSHCAKDDVSFDFLMRDVARATSAAPTYFPPAKIASADPLAYYALVDGGVVAGNPALCAYAEAVNAWHVDSGGIFMVSLGTGELRHPILYDHARNWGQLEWAQPIIDIVLQASNATVSYQLQQFLPGADAQRTYYRFQPTLTVEDESMDKAEDANLRQLSNAAEAFLDQPDVKDDLARVCERLAS